MGITLTAITKTYGARAALSDVTLRVPAGRLTALVGPSGGGKSTLLRIIAGLEHPDSGQVEIAGRVATRLPPRQRGVGLVFQHYAAFAHLSVHRNVAFALEVRRRPKAEIRRRVEELLELVHLQDHADRLPAQLSGGQRQRMVLARALAVRPEVLLLDEPFGALDPTVRQELREWLRRLHAEVDLTTLLVTHDRQEALGCCDELVVVNQGRIEQAGPPAELYDRPASEFVMAFLGPVTQLGGRRMRPHDIEVLPGPGPGAVRATVTGVHRVGAEVRVELQAPGGHTWVQLSRTAADGLPLGVAGAVWLRAAR